MKERDRVKKRANRPKDNMDWEKWRRFKNRINNKVRDEQNNQSKKRFTEYEKDITGRKMWNWVKQKAGWIKSFTATNLNKNRLNITSPLKIEEILNNYFLERGKI